MAYIERPAFTLPLAAIAQSTTRFGRHHVRPRFMHQVLLSNEGAPAADDVGYDAMAFVPLNADSGRKCGDAY